MKKEKTEERPFGVLQKSKLAKSLECRLFLLFALFFSTMCSIFEKPDIFEKLDTVGK